jgi:hypothetical protein
MPNIYVVQQRFSRQGDGTQKFHNYDAAGVYGVISYLIPSKSIVDDVYDGDINKLLEERLAHFCDDDYLILTGDAVLCAQVVLAAVSRLPESVTHLKILKWNFDDRAYFPVEITIPI